MKTYFTETKTSSNVLSLVLPASDTMQRIITWLEVTNDLGGSTMNLYQSIPGSRKTSTGAAATGQAIFPITVTAGIVANDYGMVQDVVDPTLYEFIEILSVQANVSYTMQTNFVNSYSAGARFHAFSIGGGATGPAWMFQVGAATVTKENDTAVFVTGKGQATLVGFGSCTTICATHVAGFLRS